jgi:GH25 family lysozyme M1 (1,4-beta-N-acetylmuramidase)
MDPELWELLGEGDSEDEIAAIVRLGQPNVPKDVRVVAQLGDIATLRMERGKIQEVRAEEGVISLKAPETLGFGLAPDLEFDPIGPAEGLSEAEPWIYERRPPSLPETGRGVCLGVVDWGFDFAHPDFRHDDGRTRILALWDQRPPPSPRSPQPYSYGIVHTAEDINHALVAEDPYAALGYHHTDADIGLNRGTHATHVASIAAGNGRGCGLTGVAPEADLVFVHLSTWDRTDLEKLGDSVTLLEAVHFIIRTADKRPWVINLSMGRCGEQHDGTTPVEQGLDAALRSAPGGCIVQSCGNYFQSRLHACGRLLPAEKRTLVWDVEDADITPNKLEVWYLGRDVFDVEIRSPDGSISAHATLGERASLTADDRNIGTLYHRAYEPNALDNHIEIILYTGGPTGPWELTLIGKDVVDGRFHCWIERDSVCPHCQSRFRPEDAVPSSTTGTICNGFRTIAVGAYNPHSPGRELASFSSAGKTRDGRFKPDCIAPGESILAARSAPRDPRAEVPLWTLMSGTSMAAPHVAGAVACMFQAANRLLRIEETHNLLLANTERVTGSEEVLDRVGSGYLDITRAVVAARRIGSGAQQLQPSLYRQTEEDMMNLENTIPSTKSHGPYHQPSSKKEDVLEIPVHNADVSISSNPVSPSVDSVLPGSGEEEEAKRENRFAVSLPQIQIPIGGGTPTLALPVGGSGSPFAFTVPLGGTTPTAPPQVVGQTGSPVQPQPLGAEPPATEPPTEPLVSENGKGTEHEQNDDDKELGTEIHDQELFEEDDAEESKNRNFILISGGPGTYDDRDVEHDQSWANYVIPPLLMTKVAEKDEQVWWFVYRPAYACRWKDDHRNSKREDAIRKVTDAGVDSYLELLEKRAREKGWNFSWLDDADSLWTKLKAFSKNSISRVWYWGHARNDLWLTLNHNPDTKGTAIAPELHEIIEISDIDPTLADRFQAGDLKRIHRFIGCNTAAFAQKWSEAFKVWSEGVRDKVSFAAIHKTGGEPCLVGSAEIKFFSPKGIEDPKEASRTVAKKCKDVGLAELQDDLSDEALQGQWQEEDELESPWVERMASITESTRQAYRSDDGEFGRELVELADEAISADRVRSPAGLLSELLSKARVMAPARPLGAEHINLTSPAALFDAFTSNKDPGLREYFSQVFEVVALPSSRIESDLHPGDCLVRRALGEGNLAHLATLVTGEVIQADELASMGLRPESRCTGLYAEVIDAGSFPHRHGDEFARRLGEENGQLSHDSLILRIQPHAYHSLRPISTSLEEVTGTPVPQLPTRLDGIDIYKLNTGFPSFSRIAKAGFSFVFHKASQFRVDTKLEERWLQISQAGMLRGAYHMLHHNAGSVADQVERFVSAVQRLVPGDLGPALDLEDRDPGHHADYWVPRIRQFADLIEARLGRQPIFYTSRSYWQEFVGNDLGFGQYPLWVVWANQGEPALPAGWAKWYFWQWHWEQSTSPMPTPFAASDKGVDLNRFNGAIYQLRGMADLGHTAPHLVGNQECIAYSQPDGRLHLLGYVAGSWVDRDVFSEIPWPNIIGTLPLAAGDPAAVALGNEQVIVYRSVSGGIHALTRTLSAPNSNWHAVDITGGGGKAIDDPFVLVFENNVHVIHWDQFNAQVHVMRVNGVWRAESIVDRVTPNTPSQISGSATAYKYRNVFHVVSRSRRDGHLFDFTTPLGSAPSQDLTAASHGPGGITPPAATYRPATYTAAGKAPQIIFRAVRGDIWQIERDTLLAVNLSQDAGHAPPAAGSPTAIVTDQAHVFYRTMDGTIIDIFDDAGVWRRRTACSDAAADPTAFVDSRGHAAVSFRANDGAIRIARFVNGAWKCENTTRPQSVGSGGSAPGGPEAAVTQQQEDVPSPTPVLHLEKVKISGLGEIILTLRSGGPYEGFFATPIHLRGDQTSYAQTDQKDIELIGRIQIEESGTRRNYDGKKDGKELPLGGVKGSALVKIVKADGPSISDVWDGKVQLDGTFAFATSLVVDGFTRSLTIYPKVELKGGKSITATVVVELIDLDGFLALVDPKEKARPSSQTHLEFLASVRKIYQGGPKDPLSGAFDFVLYRNRDVKPLVPSDIEDDKRFKLYKDWLFADREWIDIGHVLTGIEGSPKQDPSNQQDPKISKRQNVPKLPRPELLVTWAGDLGSALQKYIKDFWNAIDKGTPVDLNDYLLRLASRIDLIGDIDGINIGSDYDSSRSLAENLRAYYGTKSRHRYHEFIANSKDEKGKAELPLVSGKKPPQLSKQARQAIAHNTWLFLVPLQINGKLYSGTDPYKRKLVDEIIKVDSPEMDIVVEYFAHFLEDGLARER